MIETILILLVTQFLAMMSPGPDMFLILRNTLGKSHKYEAVFTILGIGLGLTVHISLSIAGLAIILVQSELLYHMIRYAGAAYLAYLGIKSLWVHASVSFQPGHAESTKSKSQAFREGLFTNLLNPKVTLYILSLFTQLIVPTIPIGQKTIFGAILIVEAVLVWIVFAYAVGLPVISSRLEKLSLWIDRLFGLILICIAGSVVLTA